MPESSASPALEPLSMREVLRIPAMQRLWTAQIVSVFGDFLALFAVIGVLTFRLHASPQQITGVQISYLLPIAILGIIAGVFVDRWPVKPTLVGSDSIRAVLVLLLLLANQIWQYYAVLAGISVVSSFFGPAQGVALRCIVPPHGLRSANVLMHQVLFAMRIVGPSAAAFLVASFGPASCYLLDSVSFAGSAILIASVALVKIANSPAPPPAEASPLKRIFGEMKQGFDFILNHAALLFVILALCSGMFILGCFGPLIAVYVRDNLRASNGTFGIAAALIGIGMLAGMNALTMVAKKVSNSTLVYCGLGGMAAGLAVLATVTMVWSTLISNLIIGFSVAAIIVPTQTMLQQETPPALMGRVGSTVMSCVFIAQIFGLVLSGMIAQAIGIRSVFGLCAVLLGLLIGASHLWMRRPATAA